MDIQLIKQMVGKVVADNYTNSTSSSMWVICGGCNGVGHTEYNKGHPYEEVEQRPCRNCNATGKVKITMTITRDITISKKEFDKSLDVLDNPPTATKELRDLLKG